jgi:hypothetical protein
VSTTPRTTASERRGNRLLEILAVTLLGVATIGSAWCGYQATRWNDEETELARQATALQLEAARQFGLATQIVSYDSNMVVQYAEAVSSGDDDLAQFLRTTLIRPEFLPVIDRWEQEIAAGREAPTNLLEDEEYREAQLGQYRTAQAEADARSVEAEAASSTASDYVLTTLILASALFFAGVTTSFRVRFARLVLIAGSALLVAYAAARLVDLPTL